MDKTRLEAFSDGVIAIIITIMVLELHPPHGSYWVNLVPLLPIFLSYIMSFTYLGIYWNNHHHMMRAVDHVDGRVLLANLHLLFWLSFIPFVTTWMADNHFARVPTALYGFVLLLSAMSYFLLQTTLIAHGDHNHQLRDAVGKDVKGKLSLVLYAIALLSAYFTQWIPISIYVIVALMWIVPDARIEKKIAHQGR